MYCKYDMKEGKGEDAFVLVHGFGASGRQFEGLSSALPYTVFTPDLLGFGRTPKPSLTYTQYLWETFIRDFCSSTVKEQFVIGGNSIGGYTAMAAAADDSVLTGGSNGGAAVTSNGVQGRGKCKGLILLNSAGVVRTKEEVDEIELARVIQERPDTVARKTVSGKLSTFTTPPDFIIRNASRLLLWFLRPRIKEICTNLYPRNPAAVTDTLCANILRDSNDSGADNVMIAGSKLPKPRTANELLGADHGAYEPSNQEGCFRGPVLLAQGTSDPLNDAMGRMKAFGGLRKGIDVSEIEGAGHCPHDEVPEEVGKAIEDWYVAKVAVKVAAASV